MMLQKHPKISCNNEVAMHILLLIPPFLKKQSILTLIVTLFKSMCNQVSSSLYMRTSQINQSIDRSPYQAITISPISFVVFQVGCSKHLPSNLRGVLRQNWKFSYSVVFSYNQLLLVRISQSLLESSRLTHLDRLLYLNPHSESACLVILLQN